MKCLQKIKDILKKYLVKDKVDDKSIREKHATSRMKDMERDKFHK